MDHSEENIRARAFELWEEEGRPEGRHHDHWHRAAAELANATHTGLGHIGLSNSLLTGGAIPGGGPGAGVSGIATLDDDSQIPDD